MEPDEQARLVEVLATSAGELVTGSSGEDTLEDKLLRLTRAAVSNIPSAEFAGLTLHNQGRLTSHGPSHPDITTLDQLQAELGEGPCVDAITSGTAIMIEVPDFTDTQERWPRFAPEALRRGVCSLLSVAMAPHDAPPGALNLYATRTGAFDDANARMIAGAVAMQAAVALYGARRIAGLETALGSRDVIGQAKGILIERYRIIPSEAFDRLAAASQHSNLKLVDVAQWLVDQTSGQSEELTRR